MLTIVLAVSPGETTLATFKAPAFLTGIQDSAPPVRRGFFNVRGGGVRWSTAAGGPYGPFGLGLGLSARSPGPRPQAWRVLRLVPAGDSEARGCH
jgi:hypothetical protein